MNENIKITSIDKEKIKKLKKTAINKIKNIVEEEKTNGKNEEELEELLHEIHEVIGIVLQKADYDMKHSYKGKDGKDYTDSRTLTEVNYFAKQVENPEKAQFSKI